MVLEISHLCMLTYFCFPSHLTSLQLCCSVRTNSFTDTRGFGIQDWRK